MHCIPGVREQVNSRPLKRFNKATSVQMAAMCPTGATEMIAAYFEDPRVRPGLMALAVRNGLWSYMQKYTAALHAHSADQSCRDAAPGVYGQVCQGQCSFSISPVSAWQDIELHRSDSLLMQ